MKIDSELHCLQFLKAVRFDKNNIDISLQMKAVIVLCLVAVAMASPSRLAFEQFKVLPNFLLFDEE